MDPIRDGDNWYVYVGNDPVNRVDLWGLDGTTIIEQAAGTGNPYLIAGAAIITTVAAVVTSLDWERGYELYGEAMVFNSEANTAATDMIWDNGKNESRGDNPFPDVENTQIPIKSRPSSPTGKWSNTDPIDPGDPGDLGGPNFPKNLSNAGKAMAGLAFLARVMYEIFHDETGMPKQDDDGKPN